MGAQSEILIVDDDRKMRDSLQGLFSLQKYSSVTCGSVQEAKRYLDTTSFDLVLLDLMLGEENGFAVMDYIVDHRFDPFVVIMTGRASADSAIKALRKGAYDYLKKPFEPDELLTTVKNALSQKKLERENYQLNAQLQQAQKLEAIGTLTGGIAHDFNNILGIILGYTEIAERQIAHSNTAQKALEQVKAASLRARDIVSQLLTFTRKERHKPEVLDIRPIIKEALKILRSTIPTSIEFQFQIPTEPATVKVEETHVHQLLINLCTNASHAMANGGRLVVELENVSLGKSDLSFDDKLHPGDFVKLSVRDTGHGIPAEDIQRIFDPYFTTKEIGKGSGLGLSVILGIVKSYGGGVKVTSAPGKGTSFEIYLPVTEKEKDIPLRATDQEIPTGSECILFVDDEQMNTELNQQRLEYLGYTVVSTTNSLHALEMIKKDSDQFDLVITDMTMPKQNGDSLTQKILRIHPGMPIILCTGYSERISETSAQELGLSKYLEKPLDTNTLAVSIREVLDKQTVSRNGDD